MNTGSKITTLLFAALLCLPLASCAEKTVGQQFREIMADIDAQCKRDRMGPYLDKSDPEYRDKRAQTSCDILKIKPADPLATEEGRFAYSIKLPAPHGELQTQFSMGMNAESYFKQLCEKDAGEWVFRTVQGVEGVFQGRRNYPLSQAGDSALIYQMYESTEMQTRNMEASLVQPYHGRYNYMERPLDPEETGKPYIRFYRGAEVPGHPKVGTQKNRMPIDIPYIVNKEQTDMLKSRYGFTWRQISTSDMLENGITGGETIIYDRTTGEVLAFRRFFGRVWPKPNSRYIRLVNGDMCRPEFSDLLSHFIPKVLGPVYRMGGVTPISENIQDWRSTRDSASTSTEAKQTTPIAQKVGKSFRDCLDNCPEMVEIPAGSFNMGSNDGYESEGPVHRVVITKPFAIGKTEVTRQQWITVMRRKPHFLSNCGDNCPINSVSWNDAQEFVKELSAKTGEKYRLPSEAEWEYACRAGEDYDYCGSDKIDRVAWYENFRRRQDESPVAAKQANAFGLYDMSGNVAEWVEDSYHQDYNGAPSDGSAWIGSGEERILRGGSFGSNAELSRATSRYHSEPGRGGGGIGFRVVRELQ